MRGKAEAMVKAIESKGITPAYAGKSEADVQFLSHSLGSPPPMRGKGSRCAISFAFPRITPAYAGKRIRRRATKDDW